MVLLKLDQGYVLMCGVEDQLVDFPEDDAVHGVADKDDQDSDDHRSSDDEVLSAGHSFV